MNTEIFMKYAPYIYFDKNEPFFPVSVGCTRFDCPAISPSFQREINFDTGKVDFVIEYAIYWHFDIGHLYELEHVWVYVGRDGAVVDCEASFHGDYIKGLLKDSSNIEDCTHVRLYSQPGKHAFSPLKEVFELIPDLRTATCENAGEGGLIVTGVAKGRYETNDEINHMVKKYLQKFKFSPSMEFVKYVFDEKVMTTWEALDMEIPYMIKEKLEEIEKCQI